MILLLAGTTEARNLAGHLAQSGLRTIASLAGVTQNPIDYPVETRIGGFGGEVGFLDYVRSAGVTAVIDATHPFATRITERTARLCQEHDIPYLRYERAPWRSRQGDTWHDATSYEALSDMIPEGATVFLATGRQSLEDIGPLLSGRRLICRVVDEPSEPFPYEGEWLVGRPPFSEAEEMKILEAFRPDWLVVKNAGGGGRGKLDAARNLGISVAMIARPPAPDGVDRREQLLDALEWAEMQGMKTGAMI
ncbi:precorrin-6A/cobalt-precorrin-6A reductase [Celeribacter litoreus]|uniref:precorrin-6A/cobalt-precorrin-6A reductase n=1 Tax=Celeribacter litoreus TaxID=2876714 RepID=UPI001CCB35F1|nr:precorrin-6A/cobalt-precorrin-6A reductase [Celeribacter litoreus]MCA0043764.1 precorrin-6A/cobalt-precorrin-6A reductase [Celeribacter litoreus]